MKRKAGVTGESSQKKTSKRNETNSKNMNSPSLARSSVKKVETTAPSKKLQKGNLGSGKTEEARNRKRKAEETQKKTKPNGTKSANPKSNSRKEKKMEPNSPNPETKRRIFHEELSSEDGNVKSKKGGKENKGNKRLKADEITSDTILSRKPSVATTPQKLVKKDILSLQKSEQRKDEHKEENIFQKNVKKFQSSTSRQQEKIETNNPFSEKTKPLKSKSQNQNGRQKTHRPSSSSRNGLSAKTSGTQKEVVAPKNQKAVQSKTETSSVDKSKGPTARRLKVMQILGLVAPAGSQFHRSRGASSRKK